MSIIVATYNAAATLERCIEAIVGQTFHSWELIVADGGSVDGTTDIIIRHGPHISYWHSRQDKGIYDAWNQALTVARGDFVCFLGADDFFYDPRTLERLFHAIGDQDYDLVTGKGRLVGGKWHHHDFGDSWDYRKVMRRMTICHPGALHRRELFRRFGQFDTGYRISADYDFLLRLPRNLRTLHLDIPLVYVSDGGVSRSRRWLMLRERFRAQASCPRIGRVRAFFNYIDKLWRIPIARALGIPN